MHGSRGHPEQTVKEEVGASPGLTGGGASTSVLHYAPRGRLPETRMPYLVAVPWSLLSVLCAVFYAWMWANALWENVSLPEACQLLPFIEGRRMAHTCAYGDQAIWVGALGSLLLCMGRPVLRLASAASLFLGCMTAAPAYCLSSIRCGPSLPLPPYGGCRRLLSNLYSRPISAYSLTNQRARLFHCAI